MYVCVDSNVVVYMLCVHSCVYGIICACVSLFSIVCSVAFCVREALCVCGRGCNNVCLLGDVWGTVRQCEIGAYLCGCA
jgi:hypothetical protein